MSRSTFSLALLAGLAVLCGGCKTYSLGFRPTDTTSQQMMLNVTATLSRADGSENLGMTNNHGTLFAPGLKAGDVVTFTSPGYAATAVRIDLNKYYISPPPAGMKQSLPIPLVDSDTLPVPMQRRTQP